MIGWAGLAGAFLAGLLSFVSPCVLPLTPIYIAQLVGPGVWQLATVERDERLRIRRFAFTMALAFVGGFSLTFIALGATASELGSLLVAHAALLRQVGGIILIALGLYVTGLCFYILYKILGKDLFYADLSSLMVLIPLVVLWFLGFKAAMEDKETPMPLVGWAFQKWFAFVGK